MSKPRDWFRFENSATDPTVAEIHIIDWIGDWIDDALNRLYDEEIGLTARAFVDKLAQVPATVQTLNVHINSPGGDVAGGVHIANALRQWGMTNGRTVVTYIDGWAASIASVIAMAGSRVVMNDNALMFIHDPWVGRLSGNARDLRKVADELDKVRDTQIVNSYLWHATISAEDIVALMAADTWLDADEALAKGFATEKVAGLKAAASITRETVAAIAIPDKYRDRVNAWLAPKAEPASTPRAATSQEIIDACQAQGCGMEVLAELTRAGATLEQVQARTKADKAARDQAAARASTITALCTQQGAPELAQGYIDGGMPIDGVKAHLGVLKVKLDAAQIDGALPPDTGTATRNGWKKVADRFNASRRRAQ